ncbi:MAG: tyrosine--tRNA ligase [Candidatus Marinimicrobia bacterium]|nr:tyrosine--tRNA ligase [Candidatus Neomarinimicrobiota bacterium]|tara:strand:- start:2167 stop:3366 length:1200 start_codon:yes stop_codon:yes gene_type:complete
MSFLPIDKQFDQIKRGCEEIIPENQLLDKLKRSYDSNTPLRVKLGCDPSRPDLHVGHGVVLRKLRHFQDLGHQSILVIGDFTAMIGDPSGRNKTRPQLTLEETKVNAESYINQAGQILDLEKLEIVYNSDWLNKMDFSDVIKLSSHYTVARMLERDDFTKRYQSETPISIHEFMYPLAQGMDSVHLNADIELGGTDQKFNLLVGRDLQKEYDQEPQCVLTLPLLEGTDGQDKMSKSYGNDIGLTDSPQEMYGKTMSITDEMIVKYFRLAADASDEALVKIESNLNDSSYNPRDAKRLLARSLVELYYDSDSALKAEDHFDEVIVNKSIPDDIPEFQIERETSLVDAAFLSKVVASKSEVRRLVKQGAVSVDGKKIDDASLSLVSGQVIKIGKRRFLKIK